MEMDAAADMVVTKIFFCEGLMVLLKLPRSFEFDVHR